MASNPLPPLSSLRKLLEYDSRDGSFHWKERADEPLPGFPPMTPGRRVQFNNIYAGRRADLSYTHGYRVVMVRRRKLYAHRLVWLFETGEWPLSNLDHINGVPSDNRFVNLREADVRANNRNMKANVRNTSGFNGVGYDAKRGTWYAMIGAGGFGVRKSIYLGRYSTQAEAIAARKAAEKVLGYHPNHGRLPVAA